MHLAALAYRLSGHLPSLRGLAASLVGVLIAPVAQAQPLPDLAGLAGHTVFGATVESHAVWSVYLGPDGRAQFTYASGGTAEATWRAADRNVLCFAFDDSGEETCKRGSAYGIGSGWSTVYPQSDGQWHPYQEDPHGSSRIFAAWPGRYSHDPASFTGDLRESFPGRAYIDLPGQGIYGVEIRPDGTGAILNDTGPRNTESAEYGARHMCIHGECLDLQISDGRLQLLKRDGDRFEGHVLYLAKGRFSPPAIPDEPAGHASAYDDGPAVIYPRDGSTQIIQPVDFDAWERPDAVRVDFKDGSPRIGGRVLVPVFRPDHATIVAVTKGYALIRFGGPDLPENCVEAYRWLWVTGPDHGQMTPPFGTCAETAKVDVTWQGGIILATITPDSGAPGTFRYFPGSKDMGEPLDVSLVSGDAADIPWVAEDDWKAIEAREAAERRAAEEARDALARKEAKAREERQRAARLDAARRTAEPFGRIAGGNLFDILAADSVRVAIGESSEGVLLTEFLQEQFTEATFLPENRQAGSTYIGAACGSAGCKELRLIAIYDAETDAVFGILTSGATNLAMFGALDWIDGKTVATGLDAVSNEIQREMAWQSRGER